MSKTKKSIIIVLVLIATAFYGGLKYGQNNSDTSSTFFAGGKGNNQFAGRGLRNGSAGMVRGDVVKKDDQSFTVALPSGGSQIVWYSSSTEVQKTVAGSPRDLVIGQGVTITGLPNTDGSLSAKTIQVRTAPPEQLSGQ